MRGWRARDEGRGGLKGDRRAERRAEQSGRLDASGPGRALTGSGRDSGLAVDRGRFAARRRGGGEACGPQMRRRASVEREGVAAVLDGGIAGVGHERG